MDSKHGTDRRSERGVFVIFAAIAIVALLGICAMVIDIGMGLVTKSELQNVSDASTLAGARELAKIYDSYGPYVSYKDHALTSAEKSQIQSKMATYASANKAAGAPVSILASDIVYGKWYNATGTVKAADKGVKAVSLKSRKDETANGALSTWMARAIGVNTLSVSATSGAGLSPLGTVPAGYGEIPIGISQHWFEMHSCETSRQIKFYPTGDEAGCAGWHTFTEYPASSAELKTVLNGLQSGSFTAPATTAGQTYYNFTGGAVASRFSDMKSLYDAKKVGNGDWLVTVPVYQDTSCANPSGSTLVVGFAKARIYGVTEAPSKSIQAEVQCDVVTAGGGNGPNDFGTLYGSPGMVQ